MKNSSMLRTHLFALSFLLTSAFGFTQEDERAAEPNSPAEWYGQAVRTAEPRTAQEELQGFHVPKGFVVDLVASEPHIQKPMNIAFDAKGRLWVTQTVEYPYPAKNPEQARDQIRILEDRDGDGYREKVTVFREGLNIPIGIVPYADGCFCFSIPNILFLRDIDGDGVCDESKVVVGPFDTTRDTHGMVNSLTVGLDGWIYANHGYNNQSKIHGSDGHEITLISGNTFRFRPDGSRVEQVTQGQVNPFGACEDRWGIRYTADCHSVPITQLLRGGCYPSFGRPDDGLGFAPSMMSHLHGSTAIAGLAIGEESHFAPSFRDNFFSGNVMTSRINRNRIDRKGATSIATELPDFLTSDDPNFRPVDLRFGPDGALYIADFYNRVIGHYEVPLDHPARDRERGRIFRIRYANAPKSSTVKSAVERLKSTQPVERRFALDLLTQTSPSPAVLQEVTRIFQDSKAPEEVRATAGWVLSRNHRAMPIQWEQAWSSCGPLLKNHLALMIGNLDKAPSLELLRSSLYGKHLEGMNIAYRAMVEAIGMHGDATDIQPLLKLHIQWSANDPVLSHAAKIAVRDLMRRPSVREAALGHWTIDSTPPQSASSIAVVSPEADTLVPILTSLPGEFPTEPLMAWMLRNASKVNEASNSDEKRKKSEAIREILPRIAIAVPLDQNKKTLPLLQNLYGDNPEQLLNLLLKIATGQVQKFGAFAPEMDLAVSQAMENWIGKILADSNTSQVLTWYERGGRTLRPWPTQKRNVDGEKNQEWFFSSIGNTEEYVGKWCTLSFDAPSQLQFLIVGHNGLPKDPSLEKNRVVLLDATTDEVLQTAFPPRSDIAKVVNWDLSSLQGRKVRMEVIDDCPGTAYAWLGVGRFSMSGFNPSPLRDALETLSNAVKQVPISSMPKGLDQLASSKYVDASGRLRLLAAMGRQQRPLAAQLMDWASQMGWGMRFDDLPEGPQHIPMQVSQWPKDLEIAWISRITSFANTHQQNEIVKLLSSRRENLPWLRQLLDQGKLGGDVLANLNDAWWETLPDDDTGKRLRTYRPADSSKVLQKLKAAEFRIANLNKAQADPQLGATLFKERCSICHKLGDVGKVIGPQLEGVGGRGLQRLAEDILLPNRNVDEQFRMSTLLFDDGQVITGWVRQRSNEVVVLADQKGELTTYPVKSVESEKRNTTSLMPDNFGEVLSDEDLASVIRFLEREASKPATQKP